MEEAWVIVGCFEPLCSQGFKEGINVVMYRIFSTPQMFLKVACNFSVTILAVDLRNLGDKDGFMKHGGLINIGI